MITRRTFLKAASTAALFTAAPALVRGQNLNSKLQIAGIGCEGKGWSDIKEMSTHDKTHMIGFCDVDLSRTENVRKLNPEAPVFQDYREMLANLGDKIDAVTVSTPDHMHAFISIDCMRQGKHIYCQKPLTHSVWEARQMRLVAAQTGVITRMGNQIHSHKFYRTAVQAVQSGAIGKVKRVHSWCAATGHGKSFHLDRPKNPVEPPKSVNWNLWIGVAPMRPYGVDRCYHPWGWRDWQDFGNGALGDFGCHILDPVYTALNIVGAPKSFKTDHTGMNDEVWPAQTQVDYLLPGTEYTAGPELAVTWYDGGLLPSVGGSHVPGDQALPRSGSLFIGEKGSLVLPHVGAPRLYPADLAASTNIPEADDLNHYHGWVDGCLSGKQPSDGFDYGGRLTEAVLLGNIGARFRGQTLEWDDKGLQITNNRAANQFIKRTERPGWEIKPQA